jgi:hypothetical protein
LHRAQKGRSVLDGTKSSGWTRPPGGLQDGQPRAGQTALVYRRRRAAVYGSNFVPAFGQFTTLMATYTTENPDKVRSLTFRKTKRPRSFPPDGSRIGRMQPGRPILKVQRQTRLSYALQMALSLIATISLAPASPTMTPARLLLRLYWSERS